MSVYNAPVLSYVGSIEPTNVVGANLFQISFDSSLNTPFIFEYIIVTDASSGLPPSVTTPANIVVQDFIYPESAQTTGVANQWILPVPFASNYAALLYDPHQTIKVRVYPETMNPTPWSNFLNLYNPPKRPVIVSATYVEHLPSISLNVAVERGSDPSAVEYVAAYYYKSNISGSTVWGVTSPVTATAGIVNGTNCWIASYPDLIDYTDLSGNTLYVSISGVFPIPGTSPQAYTVSEISSTIEASKVVPGPPTLNDISYNVYVPPPVNGNGTSPGPQSMTLTWTAPAGAGSSFTIDGYEIHRLIDDVPDPVGVLASVGAGTLTYTDATFPNTAPHKISYYVAAVNGIPPYTTTYNSNTKSENVFVYAEAPYVSVKWSTVDQGPVVTLQTLFSVQLVQPYDTGVNNGIGNITWQLYSNYAATLSSPYTVESSGTISYADASGGTAINVLTSTTYNQTKQYGVVAWLNTTDTNNGGVVRSGIIGNRQVPVSAVPFIYDASYSLANNRLTFNIESGIVLSAKNALILQPSDVPGTNMVVNYSDTLPNTLGQSVTYFDGTYGITSTVTLQHLPVPGDITYIYSVSIDNISHPLSGFAILAANAVGEGSYNSVPTPPGGNYHPY